MNHPKYEISTSMNEGIFEIVLKGKVAVHVVNKMIRDVYDIVRAKDPDKLLVDLRLMKGRQGYEETYLRLRDYPSSFHNIKHAIVDLPDNENHRTFHQYVAARVLGISLKWFTDISVARAWLHDES